MRRAASALSTVGILAIAIVVAALLLPSQAVAQSASMPEAVQAEVLRLNDRGIEAYQQARDAAAEADFQQALNILEAGGWMEDPTAAQILDNLANLYTATGRWTEAEDAYRRVLAILETLFGETHVSLALRLQILGGMLQQQGRYSEALALLNKALSIRREALPRDHPELGETVYALGQVLQAMGVADTAEMRFKEALKIWERALGAESAAVGSVLNDLGHLYARQARYREAETQLRRSLAVNEAALGPGDVETGRSLNNLAALFQAQARYAEAEELYGRAIAVWEEALGPTHSLLAGALNNLAQLYQNTGRYAAAEEGFRKSLRIHETVFGRDHLLTGVSLGNLAFVLWQQGRMSEAEPLMVRSLEVMESALDPDHPDIAASLTNLGLLYRRQGRLEHARVLLERALTIFERADGPRHLSVATALNNLADLLRAEGRDEQAEPLLLRTLEIQRNRLNPTHPDIATTVNNLGSLYFKLGRLAEAEEHLRDALTLFEKGLGAGHPDLVVPLGNLSDFYRQTGRHAEALEHSARGLAILTARRATAAGDRSARSETEFRQSLSRFRRHLDLLSTALDAGSVPLEQVVAEGFKTAQHVVSGSVAQAMKRASARVAAADSALAALVRDRQDAEDAWRNADTELLAALGRGDLAAVERLRRRLDSLGAIVDDAEAALQQEFPEYLEFVQPGALSVDELRPLLRGGEALLLYVLNTDRAHLWVIGKDIAAYRALPTTATEVANRVGLLRESLEPLSAGRLPAFPAAHAHELYRTLVAPAKDLLWDGASLLVVADGAVEGLPFGLMLTEEPGAGRMGRAEDLREAAWLTRRHAVTVVPGVSSLRALRGSMRGLSEGKGQGMQPFIGFGDPLLGGDAKANRATTAQALFRDTGSRLANVSALRALSRLPETAGELRSIAALLGAGDGALFLGANATEAVVKSTDLSRARILSFATHGAVAGSFEAVGQPGLVFTPPTVATPENDGFLTAGEVALLRLNADAVILSACNTAAPDGTPGAEGLSGLAKAFLYAGARSMLVSHWPVDSVATVTLMTRLFEFRDRNPEIGPAEALRRARLSMMQDDDRPDLAHPFYWAPFVVVGEGAGG